MNENLCPVVSKASLLAPDSQVLLLCHQFWDACRRHCCLGVLQDCFILNFLLWAARLIQVRDDLISAFEAILCSLEYRRG